MSCDSPNPYDKHITMTEKNAPMPIQETRKERRNRKRIEKQEKRKQQRIDAYKERLEKYNRGHEKEQFDAVTDFNKQINEANKTIQKNNLENKIGDAL